jgi:hypothetical protein
MLEGVEGEIRLPRSIRMAVDRDHPAMLPQLGIRIGRRG